MDSINGRNGNSSGSGSGSVLTLEQAINMFRLLDLLPKWESVDELFVSFVISDGCSVMDWPARLESKGYDLQDGMQIFRRHMFESTCDVEYSLRAIPGYFHGGSATITKTDRQARELGLVVNGDFEVACLIAQKMDVKDFEDMKQDRLVVVCEYGVCVIEVIEGRLKFSVDITVPDKVWPDKTAFVYVAKVDRSYMPEEQRAVVAWMKGLRSIKVPTNPVLRGKLERKLREYQDRRASGADLSLHGYYKLILLDAILRATDKVDVKDVVAVAIAKHRLGGFDPQQFMSACNLIMDYLGNPAPGSGPRSGGTGL